jgi:hypothetical protein
METNQLSARDVKRLQDMLLWYDNNKHQRSRTRRRTRQTPATNIPRRSVIKYTTDYTIFVNLYDGQGIEQTDSETESLIEVYPQISGVGDMDGVSRKLAYESDIWVIRGVYNNGGTPEFRWFTLEGFQTYEICGC